MKPASLVSDATPSSRPVCSIQLCTPDRRTHRSGGRGGTWTILIYAATAPAYIRAHRAAHDEKHRTPQTQMYQRRECGALVYKTLHNALSLVHRYLRAKRNVCVCTQPWSCGQGSVVMRSRYRIAWPHDASTVPEQDTGLAPMRSRPSCKMNHRPCSSHAQCSSWC